MTEPAVPHKLPTVKEYLEMEETASVRHEYVGGMIYMQAGANRRHNQIAGNIFGLIWNTARGGPCRVYQNDMKLRTADDVFYYPDVMVVCGEPVGESSVYEDAPCLVVEVASPSTESIDRREKMLAYRQIPTLEAYLIFAQDDRRVERHWRDERGEWRHGGLAGEGIVPIPCPGPFELRLKEVYEGLE